LQYNVFVVSDEIHSDIIYEGSKHIPFGSLSQEATDSCVVCVNPNGTKQSLENIKAILVQAGCTLDDVVKTTVFIKDMKDFAVMNTMYAEYFTKDCPARACIEIARLPKDALVEIEVIAICK